jgi:hypothetical protein
MHVKELICEDVVWVQLAKDEQTGFADFDKTR